MRILKLIRLKLLFQSNAKFSLLIYKEICSRINSQILGVKGLSDLVAQF